MSTPPLVLEGAVVRLEPLDVSHHDALVRAADDGELWRSTVTVVPDRDAMAAYLAKAFAERQTGRQYPFAIVHKPSGRVAGTTRYMNIEPAHRRREIGSTWLAASTQRTAVNTEAKFLLLRHAFEDLSCIRVEFVTDVLNLPSRAALVRIGAVQEGVIRNHMVMPGGRYRDSALYSIVEAEWPEVKRRLAARLGAAGQT